MDRALSRLWANVDRRGDDECWPFQKSTGSHGYGQLGYSEKGKNYILLAHRAAYILSKGNIPEGMTVDHICHSRTCCNPAHLRLLTNQENGRDNNAKKIKETIMARYGHHNTRLIHQQKVSA